MSSMNFTFGFKKLYFWRLKRACQLLKQSPEENFCQSLLGIETYCKLCMPEDFSLCVRSEKLRIICVIWCLLSRYKFKEAARLLVHSMHSFPMAASWIWRVAFHIFRCLNEQENFRKFNNILDQARLSDENNRVLERILHHMVQGDLDAAHKCRSHKVTHRDRYTSVESTITREPEYERVRRLQRLYEGLSLYALWCERRSSTDSLDPEQAATDELAEKAYHRLQEVEAMISGGYLCDVFIRPLVEILEYFGESSKARSLLVRYKHRVPENPNTLRYLCEWYKMHCNPCDLGVSDLSDRESLNNSSTNAKRISFQTSASKASKRLLTSRIKFSKHVLPEPAPAFPSTPMTLDEEKKYLRLSHPHMFTIVACLKHGRILDALEISFALLDHPSWAFYTEPWKLLKRSIRAIGKRSPEVIEAIRIRKRIWSRLYFSQRDNLPTAANFTRKLFANAPVMSATTNNSPEPLGPLLTVEPIHVRNVELSDISEQESSF